MKNGRQVQKVQDFLLDHSYFSTLIHGFSSCLMVKSEIPILAPSDKQAMDSYSRSSQWQVSGWEQDGKGETCYKIR